MITSRKEQHFIIICLGIMIQLFKQLHKLIYIYQTNPDWLPDPSADRSEDYVQEALPEDDEAVKKIRVLPKRELMDMFREKCLITGKTLDLLQHSNNRKASKSKHNKQNSGARRSQWYSL